MVKTITTHSHCAVKDSIAYEGTKEQIVRQVCWWHIEPNTHKLMIKFKRGFKGSEYHSYSKEFTDDEMRKDAILFIFEKLPEFGYKLYREVS